MNIWNRWSGYYPKKEAKVPKVLLRPYRYGDWPEGYEFPDFYSYPPKLTMRAGAAVARAVSNGMLRPSNCQICGNWAFIESHHESYCFPLMVVWLCHICHQRIHVDKRYDRDHTSQTEPSVAIILHECLPNIKNRERYDQIIWRDARRFPARKVSK